MPPEGTLRALAAVIRRQDSPQRLQHSPRAFLAEAGADGADLDQLARVGADRLLVYRRLVLGRFIDTVQLSMPRTAARRGAEALRRDVAAFVDERASRSPYLRDIASEFVAWAAGRWPADPTVPGYLPDLARHEVLSFEIASQPEDHTPGSADELDLERPVRLQQATQVVRYDHAVHRLPADEDDRSEPEVEAVALLAYRDLEHRVRHLELGPAAAAILEGLIDQRLSLREGIASGSARAGVDQDDELLGAVAVLLADLAERGVLIGSEPLSAAQG